MNRNEEFPIFSLYAKGCWDRRKDLRFLTPMGTTIYGGEMEKWNGKTIFSRLQWEKEKLRA